MKIQQSKKGTFARGFSLVEMLVVIAVIGIIAAIAVPNIGKINDSAKIAKNQRNAQSIASMFAAADAAGHDFAGTTKNAVAAEIVAGVKITDVDSPFKDRTFKVPGLSTADIAAADDYLAWDDTDKTLSYTKTLTP